jgi:polysaccharide biosynthesis/export protein
MNFRNRLGICLLMAASLLLSACGGKAVIGGAQDMTILSQDTSLPEPTGADFIAGTRPYLIGPFDKLSIDVFGIEELNRDEVQVDANGTISLPLAGTINAAGKSPPELARDIERGLRANYVRNPQVSVNLKETVSQVVTVDGEVDKPGLYPVIGKMTLLRAVATAGGTGEFARLEDVIVFRTVETKRYAGVYNLKAIRQGNYDDPEVFANDVIVVGDSAARRRFKDLIQLAPLLSTPLLLIFQNRN